MPKVTYAYFGIDKFTGERVENKKEDNNMEDRYLYAFVDEDLIPKRGSQNRISVFKSKGYALGECHRRQNKENRLGYRCADTNPKIGIYKLVEVIDADELERR